MALPLDWAREAVEPGASVPMAPTNSWRLLVSTWVVMLGLYFIIVCERMSIGRCCMDQFVAASDVGMRRQASPADVMCFAPRVGPIGCLVTCAEDRDATLHGVAAQVAKILSGTKPAEISCRTRQRRSSSSIAKAAKALGLTIPPSLPRE
jgi:hypothetical protein